MKLYVEYSILAFVECPRYPLFGHIQQTREDFYGFYIDRHVVTLRGPCRFTYLQAPYYVEDAKGFVFPVPSEYSFDELENVLVHKFRAGACAREVQAGNYELCNTKRRSERITAMSGLRPGLAIKMAIIITRYITLHRRRLSMVSYPQNEIATVLITRPIVMNAMCAL